MGDSTGCAVEVTTSLERTSCRFRERHGVKHQECLSLYRTQYIMFGILARVAQLGVQPSCVALALGNRSDVFFAQTKLAVDWTLQSCFRWLRHTAEAAPASATRWNVANDMPKSMSAPTVECVRAGGFCINDVCSRLLYVMCYSKPVLAKVRSRCPSSFCTHLPVR